jgi:prevent-host-death family protein
MRLSTQVKPISYFKANAAELLKDMADTHQPLAITQNGEVTAVVQDIASYEATEEALALLKILALADRDIEAGNYRPAREVIAEIRAENGL